jgi:hypothetical protein
MLDPAHLAAGPFVDSERIEFIAPPARLAVKVSLVVGCLDNLPVSAVFTIASENSGHLFVSPLFAARPILLEK